VPTPSTGFGPQAVRFGCSLHHASATVAAASTTPIVDGCDVAVASTGRRRPVRTANTPLEHHRSGDQQDRRQRASIERSGHRWLPPCANRQPTVGHDLASLLLPVTCTRNCSHPVVTVRRWRLVEANPRLRSLIVGNWPISSPQGIAVPAGHRPVYEAGPTSHGLKPKITLPARRPHWYATDDSER
jgi:hypothetical protein